MLIAVPVDKSVTRLIEQAQAGEARAAEELLPLVYAQLRQAAEIAMRNERPGHTLQATALVHEAFVKLCGGSSPEGGCVWAGRAHFYHAAARAMRQLLIDHARSRGRLKRGGDGRAGAGARRVLLNVADLAAESDPSEILALDEAVSRLESVDADAAAVVRLRFYAGLTGEQTAEALDISPRQVDRVWSYARAFLYSHLAKGEGGPGAT